MWHGAGGGLQAFMENINDGWLRAVNGRTESNLVSMIGRAEYDSLVGELMSAQRGAVGEIADALTQFQREFAITRNAAASLAYTPALAAKRLVRTIASAGVAAAQAAASLAPVVAGGGQLRGRWVWRLVPSQEDY